MKKAWVLSYPLSTQQRLWSDWVDAQADLSLSWVHICCHEAAHLDSSPWCFQILVTVPPSAGSKQSGGIQVELDEIESRNEEYLMTRAFLELLTSLTDTPVPVALGVGTRIPGFEPYLQFVMDVVFLRFNSRAYKDPAEKVGPFENDGLGIRVGGGGGISDMFVIDIRQQIWSFLSLVAELMKTQLRRFVYLEMTGWGWGWGYVRHMFVVDIW